LATFLDSDALIRATRARTCEAYSYDACCSRIPIVEALPSERAYDAANSLQCLVARPMIEFLIDQIRRDKAAIATKAKHAFGYRYLLTIFIFSKGTVALDRIGNLNSYCCFGLKHLSLLNSSARGVTVE